MFHWTDNPILISGDYILILDPLQRRLPFNNNFQARKPGVKILLSKMKQMPNQLVPFQDLWGYDVRMDHYDGTIFRFPLRKYVSPLREKQEPPSVDSVRLLLDQYFKEARISLLFLKEVKMVTFKGPGTKELFWSVKKRNSTSDYTVCSTKQMVGPDRLVIIEDKWWIYSKVEETPSTAPEYQSRVRKNLEYGIAALVSSENELDKIDDPTPKIFSTLPLPEASNLPVHVHATFSLSGDRNTLITGGESSEASGSNWNAWLLEEKLADAYLAFLEGLVEKIGSDVFRFWPHRSPNDSRVELLCKSFWSKLPSSSARLFPRRIASPAKTNMTISETVFDFLLPEFSRQIAPVLEILEPNLPTHFPAHILINVKSMDVKSINRPALRKLFKSKIASACLQEAMRDDDGLLIKNVLNEVISVGDILEDELSELDGCKVLPLADGTLGQLTMKQSPMPPNTRNYYVATNSEATLFNFAKGVLIVKAESSYYDRIEQVLKTNKFNVMRLTLSHVPELLSMKSQGSRVVDTDTDKWLKSFWDHWNKSSSSTTVDLHADLHADSNSFCNLPLFKAVCDGTWGYHTMSELRNLPAIINPSEEPHKRLCDSVSGLYILSPNLMPRSTADAEKSLAYPKAFRRFIDALRILAPDSISIEKLFARLVNEQKFIKVNLYNHEFCQNSLY